MERFNFQKGLAKTLGAGVLMLSITLSQGAGLLAEAVAVSPDQAGIVVSMDDADEELDLSAVEPGMLDGNFSLEEVLWPAKELYEFPYLGLKMRLNEEWLRAIDEKKLALLDDLAFKEDVEDGFEYRYMMLSLSPLSDQESKTEFKKIGTVRTAS